MYRPKIVESPRGSLTTIFAYPLGVRSQVLLYVASSALLDGLFRYPF